MRHALLLLLVLPLGCSSTAQPGGSSDAGSSDGARDGALDGPRESASADGPARDSAHDTAPPSDGGAVARCTPLGAPTGPVVDVTPAQAGTLTGIVAGVAPGTTIRLADGTYNLGGAYLWIAQPGVVVRGASGDREAVILDGEYTTTEIITVAASNVTIADLTVRRSYTHAIHVTTGGSDVVGTLIHNVHLIDPREQAVKINPGSSGGYPDHGVVSCSRMELTDTGRPHVNPVATGCYTGGVDGHQARGWTVRDSVIEGFWCPTGLSEHGVHFWDSSRDTLVERNVFRDNARAVGFGLSSSGTASRTYSDGPCPGLAGGPYVDHFAGVVRNNFVFVTSAALLSSGASADCGVCLWSSCQTEVLHNTIVSTGSMFSAVEWRFAASQGITVANNLSSHPLMARENAAATLTTNQETAPLGLFVNGAQGDLHLTAGAAVIDQATPGYCTDDIDGEPRDSQPDLGADER